MARMDEGGPVAARDLGLADQLDAVGLEAAHERVQPVDVDRQVVKPLAPPLEEALDEASRACALDQLRLVAREPEALEVVRPVPAELLLPRRLDREDAARPKRSEELTSELQSRSDLVCRLLLEKKKR